jgi:hypothetical protein
MRNRTKLLLGVLTVAVTLGALVSATPANRLARSSSTFRTTITMKLSGFATVTCRVTMEGSFHSKTIAKVAESLIGYVSKATVQECTGGSASAHGLPWHMRYVGFEGSLPAILNNRDAVWNFSIQVTAIGIECGFTSTGASPLKGIETRNTGTGVAESLRIDETAQIPKSSGGSFCGTSGREEGTSGSLTVGGGTAKITVTLVA